MLLLPVYVTLFWAIALMGNKKIHSVPRAFLSKFMLFPFVIYICHFFYFAPLPEVYPYFDILLQFASLLVFPIYYIYFRLLTVDEKFSLKTHAVFLAIPTILTFIYAVGVVLTPAIEYRAWLFDDKAYSNSVFVNFLSIMRVILRITYLAQVLLTVTGNFILIRKYGAKAEQFYSDIQDGKFNNAKMLNYSIIIMSIAAFLFTVLGRRYLVNQDILIYGGWTVFSAMLFIIGYMGITQKSINPTYELVTDAIVQDQLEDIPMVAQKKLLRKMLVEFETKKIYLNSQLNIMDVVKIVGTNRTYISSIINQHYNQNFCTFVNSYRVEELERVFQVNPDYTNEELAESCGFGSVNSLKRAINSKTGLSITAWKQLNIGDLNQSAD